MKVKTTISYYAAKLASELPKIIEKYMQRYARSAEKGSKEAIDKGILIKPLNPATGKKGKLQGLTDTTIALRRARGIGGTKPLFATGRLYRSIKGTSEGLQMIAYGLKHQKGFKNPEPLKYRDVPARPFIGASKKETLTAFNKFKKDMRKAFKK